MYQIVNKFTDDSTREHLQCVLESPLPESHQESSPPKQPPANHRAQLYARMGVLRKSGGKFYYSTLLFTVPQSYCFFNDYES